MKVLFLTRSFYPNIGGVEKHVLKISQELTGLGYEITVLTEASSKSYSKNYHSGQKSAKVLGKTKNIRTVEIEVGEENWFKKFRVWKEIFIRFNLILSADIIHCHDVFYWYLPFRFLFPFKRVYTTFHGYEGNNLPKFKAIVMHKIAEKLSYGNICVGKFLKKWYGTKANIITYGAIDTNILKDNLKNSNSMDKGIFIGRLEYETGILEYLHAIKQLKEKNVNVALDIFGNGDLKQVAQRYAKKNKLEINFLGFKEDIENYLSNYSFAFVSRYLGILEAIAARLRVYSVYNNAIKKDYLYMTPFAKYINIAGSSREICVQFLKKGKTSKHGGYDWVRNMTWKNMANLYINLWKI